MNSTTHEIPLPNDEVSLSVLLYRYFWPFWLFRDASKGDMFARASAYRHNCEMSIHLPSYIVKWSIVSAVVLLAVLGWDSIQANADAPGKFYALVGAAVGMLFTCCFCVVCIIGSIYVRFRYE